MNIVCVNVGDPIVDVVVNLDYDDAQSLLGKYTPGEWCLVSGHDMKHLLTRLDNDHRHGAACKGFAATGLLVQPHH